MQSIKTENSVGNTVKNITQWIRMSYKKNVNANKQELSRKKRRTNKPTVLNLEDRSDMAGINPNI